MVCIKGPNEYFVTDDGETTIHFDLVTSTFENSVYTKGCSYTLTDEDMELFQAEYLLWYNDEI
ncbi:MAG: hypothetical protein EOM67_11740 [Spirochaetia bacterium]|nr:hypothetical protein [Spirochaetia bacterium]